MDKQAEKGRALLMDGAFGRMFLVMLVGMLVTFLTGVVDAIVTGQFLGSRAVAAMGLAGPVLSIAAMVMSLLVAGTSQLCARNFGKADIHRVNQIFSTMALCAVSLCTLAGFAVFFLSPGYLAVAAGGADEEALLMARDYLHGFAFLLPPMGLSILLNSLMTLDNDQKRSMGFALILLVSDLVFDLLNVLVFHGGMLGMALASVFSAYLALFWLLLHFRQPGHFLEFTPRDLSFGDLPEVLNYGLAGAMPVLMNSLRALCFNAVFLSVGGTDAVAALTVAVGAFFLIVSLVTTAQSTTETVAGLAYGEEDVGGIEGTLRNGLSLSYRACLLIGLILVVFAHPIAGIFLDDPTEDINRMAATLIRFMVLQYLLMIASYSLTGVFAGTGHIKLNYIVSLLRDGIFPCLGVAALGYLFGMPGILGGLLLSGALTLCLFFALPGILNRRFPRRMRDFLILPDSFSLRPSECFEAAASDMEEVVAASKKAYDFCIARGEDKRTANFVSLFIEEMAGNTIRHGFEEGKKGRVEVKLILKEGKRMLRLKDNGSPFDPVEWLEKNRTEDPMQNIGIRMVVGLAKEVRHVRAMEINNLIIDL